MKLPDYDEESPHKHYIDILKTIDRSGTTVNNWETTFIESNLIKYEERGADFCLTLKQIQVVEDMEAKYL